jgi:hypothetical protein
VTLVAQQSGRRPLWLTVPLHLALAVVGAVNAWAASFWLRVDGRLGLIVGGAASLVVLVVVVLIGVDARRQWLLGRN